MRGGVETQAAQECGRYHGDLRGAQQRAVVFASTYPRGSEIVRLRISAELDQDRQRIAVIRQRSAGPRGGWNLAASRERGVEEVAVRFQFVGEALRLLGIGRAFWRRRLDAKLLKQRDVLIDDQAERRIAVRGKAVMQVSQVRPHQGTREAFQREGSEMYGATSVG